MDLEIEFIVARSETGTKWHIATTPKGKMLCGVKFSPMYLGMFAFDETTDCQRCAKAAGFTRLGGDV